MAPAAKRKRGGGGSGGEGPDGSGRPSPHRPESLSLANPGRSSHPPHNHSHHSPQSPVQHRGRGAGGRGRYSHGGRTNGSQVSQQVNAVNTTSSAASDPSHTDSAPANPPNDKPTVGTPPNAQPHVSSSKPPTKPPMPYHYDFITNDRVSTWIETGRSAVLDLAVQICASQDFDQVCMLFQELLRAGIDGRIQPADMGKLVSEIIAASSASTEESNSDPLNLPELFLDTLSIMTEADSSNPNIKPLVLATGISADLMREILEIPLLQNLGLIRPTFDRVFIRKQTNILYKQSNYNLLREETEGYSKLLTELFTTSNNEPPTAEVVQDTFENVKALIGAFDLDAGRVLDVILDLFATLLVKQYRFFVKLLRASSWWPQDQTYGFHTQGQGFDSLPSWAQPNHSHWLSSEDEKARLALLRTQRDRQFWDRARQIGMDAFFQLGGRSVADDEVMAALLNEDNEANNSANIRGKETRDWIKLTKTLPPPGNSVAAQLLGFKLRFYASNARDAHDSLPVNLIYLAALLIKIGFISLRDLYPHLFPEDDALRGMKDKLLTEKEEREAAKRPGGGSSNALAKAGALSDDTAPQPISRLRETATVAAATARASTPSRMEAPAASTIPKSDATATKPETLEEEKEQLPEPADQKVQLLRSLLCIGAIPEALYLLGRFPWIPDAFPDLPDHLHRILHYALHKVYEPLRPLSGCDGIRASARIPAMDQGGLPKAEIRLQNTPPPKTLRWAQLDKNELSDGIEYRFYWDDWSDNVPVCQNVDDVFTLCSTLLNYSGVKIGQDPTLLVKLVRIGTHSLAEDSSEKNRTRWYELCKRVLVPALSLTKVNPGVVNEVYDLLKQYSTPLRFALYNEWFLGVTSRLTDIRHAFDLAKAQTRDTMRRMTKENQRQMARALAKVACASPGVVFQVIFNQIESYTNMIDVVVECGRYFTDMGYDVLTWTLLSSLGRAGRSRVSQKNGINVSQWLASLSQFAGKLCRRYSVVRTLPILQYVLQQLRIGNFADLQILKELIMNMAGIVPDTDFTDAQVQAMAGGELLQGQILRQVQDRRHESKTPGKRLTKSIVDHDLTGSLLVAIAQQRQICVFNDNLTQVKAMSENYDNVHIVLTQYTDLLRHSLPIKEFDALVPDLPSLILDFGIEPSVAFMIHRKSIAKAIEDYDAANPVSKKRSADHLDAKDETDAAEVVQKIEVELTKVDEDVEMTGNEASVVEGDIIQEETPKSDSKDADLTVEVVKEDARVDALASKDVNNFKWHPVLQQVMDQLRPALPGTFENSMSLPFFVSFWQLALNDLTLPTQSYNDEISRQKDQIAAINADRSDTSAAGSRKKEAEKKSINEFLSKLTEEMKNSVSTHSHVRQRLDKEKQHWFAGFAGDHKHLIDSILQDCFFPRMLISPLDSQYAWRMLNFVHSSGAPGFNTRQFLEKLFHEKYFSNVLLHFTAREAENFGRFFNEVFKELGTWHATKNEYEKKAYGPRKNLPGFALAVDESGKPTEFLGYEDFRNRMYFWHANVCNAIKAALNVDEYVHIRNACIVLKATNRHFPAVNWMGSQIAGILQGISTAEGKKANDTRRDDIWVLSTSVLGNLKARQKHWVLPQAFHISNNNQRAASRQASNAPRSPYPDLTATSKPLNAEAAAFEPKPTVTDLETKVNFSAKSEVEDGELEDVAMSGTGPSETVPSEVPAANSGAGADKSGNMTEDTNTNKASNLVASETNLEATESKAAYDENEKPSTSSETEQASQLDTSSGETADMSALGVSQASSTGQKSDGNSRPNMKREHSASGNSDRQPHALPSRPDLPTPHARSQRHQNGPGGARTDRPDRGRLPADVQRGERSGHSYSRGDTASNSRYPEAGRQGDREGRLTPSEPARKSGPRDIVESRSTGVREDRPDSSHGTPRFDGHAQSDQPGTRSTASNPPSGSNVEPSINPERAALIEQRDLAGTGQRSRGHSPTRGDGRYDADYHAKPDSRRDVRSDVRRSAPYESRPTREFSAEHPPNGPRSGLSSRQGHSGDGPSRSGDLMQPPPPRGSHDRGHGRYSLDSPQRGPPNFRDENYGRLNADTNSQQGTSAQNSPAPSTARNQRSVNTSQNRRQGAADAVNSSQPPSPAKDRQFPSASASNQRTQTSSAPSTPAAETQNNDLSGVHPSRLEKLNVRPQSLQTESANSTQQTSSSEAAPSAPRPTTARGLESGSATSGNSPAPRNAPAGPSSGNERRRGEGSARRQLADMQQTLSGSGPAATASNGNGARNTSDQGTSIRGRAATGRQQQPSNDSQDSRFPEANPPGAHGTAERIRSGPPAQDGGESFDRSRKELMQARSEGTRNGRARDEPNSRSYRSSREPSRDERLEGGRISERERSDRQERMKDHARSLRGGGPERDRERERERSPHREVLRGMEREPPELRGHAGHGRDPERDRRDAGPDHPRQDRGPPYQQSSGPSASSNGNGPRGSGRRGDGRDTRELIGAPGGGSAGRGAPGDGRKRGWAGEDGEGSTKRPRRGGYNR